MKRSLCLLLALPVTVYAETYQISDTDLSIQFDNSIWYVFTRDNIENNPELEELGVSYEDMCNILNNNNAYMDSVLYYDDGDYIELFVRKTAQTSGMANLSNYSDGKVTELAAALAKGKMQRYTLYTKISINSSDWNIWIPAQTYIYTNLSRLLTKKTTLLHSSLLRNSPMRSGRKPKTSSTAFSLRLILH